VGPFIIAAIYSGLGFAAVFLSVADAYLPLMELHVVPGPRMAFTAMTGFEPNSPFNAALALPDRGH
jgi:hypothetical protein